MIKDESEILRICNLDSNTLSNLKKLLNSNRDKNGKSEDVTHFLGYLFLKAHEKKLNEENN